MKGKLLLLFCFFSLGVFAQNDTTVVMLENEEPTPVRIFYSQRLINTNTVEVIPKGSMEFKVIHNFGDIGGDFGGGKNFYGLDNASDIKIAFHIGLGKRLNIVAARTRGDQLTVGDQTLRVAPVRQLWELGLKYQFMRQLENDPSHPVSVTMYVNTVVSTMDTLAGAFLETKFKDFEDRLSEVVQLIVARKFGKVSLQLNPIYVHRHLAVPGDDNGNFALGGAVRLPLSKKFFLIADYFHTFRSDEAKEVFRSHGIPLRDVFGVGVEIVTEGHIFNLNFTNARTSLENRYIPLNTTSWGKGEFRWGFTISRKFVLFKDKKKK